MVLQSPPPSEKGGAVRDIVMQNIFATRRSDHFYCIHGKKRLPDVYHVVASSPWDLFKSVGLANQLLLL